MEVMSDLMNVVGYTESLPISDPRSLFDARLPVPEPGPHDLRVEVRAVSVNPVDAKQRLRAPSDQVQVLGYDAAGVVDAVGPEVTLFRPGDAVYYAGTINRPGTDAEYHLVDERIVGRIPRSLDFEQSAAIPLTALTAWEGTFDKLGIEATTTGTLLVVGATGGVGAMIVQLVHVLAPRIRVVATASTPEKAEWVRGLGAAATVNHHADLRAEIHREAPEGIDFIYTTHTAGNVETYIDVLNAFGQIVAIDDPGPIDVAPLKGKALSWHWESMFARSVFSAPDLVRQHEILDAVAQLVDEGKVRTTLSKVMKPFDAKTLRDATELVESDRTVGKIVISRA
jgi:zinc-binding alcohol dehydrogenase family protein